MPTAGTQNSNAEGFDDIGSNGTSFACFSLRHDRTGVEGLLLMNILALNPGSGTLLFQAAGDASRSGAAGGEVLTEGKIDHVHGDRTVEAAERAVSDCLFFGVDAIGFRVVHGGSRFDGPTRITPEVLEEIRSLADLAPLHNPVDLSVIEAASRRVPERSGRGRLRHGLSPDSSRGRLAIRRSFESRE